MADITSTSPLAARGQSLTAGFSVHLLLLLSGFAGLGYQIVWTRMLSVGLGHEVIAVLAVVAAFFAGLALGALLLDRRIAASARPGHWYAGLEALIGLWTLALIWLIPAANDAVAGWMGPEPGELRRWTIAFAMPLVLLLPATVAMGASLPAAEGLFARLSGSTAGIGGLYAANTGGAMAGALLTAFLIAPEFGYTATLLCFAAVNFLCAGLTLAGPARGAHRLDAPRSAVQAPRATGGLKLALFASGLLGVGFEVATIRALSQLFENTIYSFATSLAVYLLMTALGASAYQLLYADKRQPGWDGAALLPLAALTALACALGTAAVFAVPGLYPPMASIAGPLLAEIAMAALVLGPASAAMGALFSHLFQGCRGAAGGLGSALAANTLGGAIAPCLVGIVAIPALGVIPTLMVLSLGYLIIALPALALSSPTETSPNWLARPMRAGLMAATPVLLTALYLSPLDQRLVSPPEGGRVVAHIEGVSASASVVEDAARHRHLRVNGTFTMGGTASYTLDRVQGHAALMQHPEPRRALFLGVGTGATLAAAGDHPRLRTTGVELLPEVLDLVPEFEIVQRDLSAAAPRMTLTSADARRYVRAAPGPFDVILADNYHPAKDGAALLYTVEHFRAIREKLSSDGIFAQWLPLHQLDLPTLAMIVRSFMEVFPDARLHMGNYNLGTPILALYGSADGARPRLDALMGREMTAELREALSRAKLDSPFALFGGFIAGPEQLAAFASTARLNSDDHPRILFEAPRTVYEPLAPASERLLWLVEHLARTPDDAVDTGGHRDAPFFKARLAAYWKARDAFLRAGAELPVTGNVSADARTIVPRLIEITAISPDFRPAYDPVLAMTAQLANVEAAYAVRLLEDLIAAHPLRREGRELKARIEAALPRRVEQPEDRTLR